MHLSQQGLALLKQFEGLELKAYQDSAGIWTIGYGDTGPSVSRGITITKQEAEERLKARLTREFEPGVVSLVKVPLTQNQFDALVCFAYNVGIQALRGSTLLKKLNGGDYAGAANEFGRWNRAGGRVLSGLISRRAAERACFEAEIEVGNAVE